MLNFYFTVRFLGHQDNIVRNRIANFFYLHKLSDESIPPMIMRGVQSFGVAYNLPALSLLPFQELDEGQLRFFLDQRHELASNPKVEKMELIKEYHEILKKTLRNQSQSLVRQFTDELSPDFLKTMYKKKWKNIINRDLFKLYSQYTEAQLQAKMFDFIAKHKRKVCRKSYFTEIKILAEVLYISLHRSRNIKQKNHFIEKIGNYFSNIGNRFISHTVKRKVYPLEAYAYLINVGWWSLDKFVPKMLELFTIECESIVYEEAVGQLLEMDFELVLPNIKELLLNGKVKDSAYAYLLRLLYLSIEFDEADSQYSTMSEEIILAALEKEKSFSRKVELCLALSNLFSEHFLKVGEQLLKSQVQFTFAVPSYAKYKAILEERLLVHSLITGVYLKGLDGFVNNYIEKKPTLVKRINASLFFYRKKTDDDGNNNHRS